MSPQMIQKLPAITLLEGMFPELSTNQLKVCVFYAMGVPYDAIAQNCRLSPETVRNLPEAKPEELKSGRI